MRRNIRETEVVMSPSPLKIYSQYAGKDWSVLPNGIYWNPAFLPSLKGLPKDFYSNGIFSSLFMKGGDVEYGDFGMIVDTMRFKIWVANTQYFDWQTLT